MATIGPSKEPICFYNSDPPPLEINTMGKVTGTLTNIMWLHVGDSFSSDLQISFYGINLTWDVFIRNNRLLQIFQSQVMGWDWTGGIYWIKIETWK